LIIVFSITTVIIMTDIAVSRQALAAAARALAHAGRWQDAADLLAAAPPGDPLLALAAAQVAVESEWFAGTSTTPELLTTASWLAAGLDDAGRWDLAFVELRHAYRTVLMADGSTRTSAEAVRGLAADLDATAPDAARKGWAAMYQGLIADNLLDEPDAAPAHYHAALRAGLDRGDGFLAREAQRHLGGHDHDAGNDEAALDRWRRATELGAAAGNVPGTLSQQLLLAVLARAAGNEAGAVALAAEVARWAAAIGAAALAAQAAAFIAGADPTAPPPKPTTAAPEPAAPQPIGPSLPAGTTVADVPLLVSFMTAPLATTPRQ
jgi:tetratricopeptide (TPR) repeat protein